jgi:hypothetical protein
MDKKNSSRGISNMGLFLTIAFLSFIFFFLAPKYLNRPKSEIKKTEAPSEKEVPYVGVYHKGMSQARDIVQASKER